MYSRTPLSLQPWWVCGQGPLWREGEAGSGTGELLAPEGFGEPERRFKEPTGQSRKTSGVSYRVIVCRDSGKLAGRERLGSLTYRAAAFLPPTALSLTLLPSSGLGFTH